MMRQKPTAITLREIADMYFHPEYGDALVLADEFNYPPEYVKGMARGLTNAHNILLGLAEWYEDGFHE